MYQCFFLETDYYINTPFPTFPPTDGHGHLYLLASVKLAALNTGVQLYLQPLLSILLDTHSETGLLDLFLGPVKSKFFHKQCSIVNCMTKWRM